MLRLASSANGQSWPSGSATQSGTTRMADDEMGVWCWLPTTRPAIPASVNTRIKAKTRSGHWLRLKVRHIALYLVEVEVKVADGEVPTGVGVGQSK